LSASFHWGMAGVGATLLVAALAPGGSKELDIVLLLGSAFLILFALRWPQRTAGVIAKGVNAVAERIRRDQNATTAIRLCQAAIAAISGLPIRESGELKMWQLLRSRWISEAGALYKRRHRAATIDAVRAALRAGAADNGALQLAENAHWDAELLELKAELLRIVFELDHGTELLPAGA
jgi:hypothetical protein